MESAPNHITLLKYKLLYIYIKQTMEKKTIRKKNEKIEENTTEQEIRV